MLHDRVYLTYDLFLATVDGLLNNTCYILKKRLVQKNTVRVGSLLDEEMVLYSQATKGELRRFAYLDCSKVYYSGE